MKTQREIDQKEDQFNESTISQFRRYLSEISQIQPLAVPIFLSWWDK